MADKKKLGFAENFMLSGVAAAVSKTAAAPIERVKLLVQNQVKSGWGSLLIVEGADLNETLLSGWNDQARSSG